MHPTRARRAALWLAPVVALGVLGPWVDARAFGFVRSYYGYDGVAGAWALAGGAAAFVALRVLRPGAVRARVAAAAFGVAALPAALVLVGLRLIPVDDIGGAFEASWRPSWGLFVALGAALAGAALAWRSHEREDAPLGEDEGALAAASVVSLAPGR